METEKIIVEHIPTTLVQQETKLKNLSQFWKSYQIMSKAGFWKEYQQFDSILLIVVMIDNEKLPKGTWQDFV